MGGPSIYALCSPETGELRYIGKANNPKKRLASHLRASRSRETPVYDWMRKLARTGLIPEMVVLAEDCADWQSEERRLIREARNSGYRLLNVADGGNEPYCSPEVRKANGERLMAYLRGDLPAQSREVSAAERDMENAVLIFRTASWCHQRNPRGKSELTALLALKRIREIYRSDPKAFKKYRKYNGPSRAAKSI